MSSETDKESESDICFSKSCSFKFDFSNPTAESILNAVIVYPERFREHTPPKAVRENRAFTLEGFDHDEIMCDDNGAYMRTKNVKSYFRVEMKDNGILKAQSVHGNAPDFFIKVRSSSRNYTNVNIPQNEVYLLERIYRDSKSFNGLKHIVARVKQVDKEDYEKYSLVIYSRNFTPAEHDHNDILPHGNAKKTTLPYIRTSKTVLEKETELLQNLDSRPSMIYDDLVNTFDPFTTTSQSSEPRNLKQIQNRKYQMKTTEGPISVSSN